MKVIRDLDWCPRFERGTVVTFGEFDGVHRGHRVVLLETVRAAVVEGCPTVVVTFDPRAYTDDPSAVPLMLTEPEQKVELLEACEVDWMIELPADQVSRGSDNREAGSNWIVDEVLTKTINARAVVVGEDYHFGRRRRETLETLERRSSDEGFRIVRIPVESRRTATGDVVSARSVRDALDAGAVADATDMLGRPHEIRSVVTQGERRGRKLGFPTVNLPTPQQIQIPAEGVYAGWYLGRNGARYRAAINIGRRPTFYDNAHPLIEAHLLDFTGDLYGEKARLQFVQHLRPEQKFDGIDALKAQLDNDIAAVRELLPQP